jgi:3-keto-L-gulonate-6-phosphate decarboxylase
VPVQAGAIEGADAVTFLAAAEDESMEGGSVEGGSVEGGSMMDVIDRPTVAINATDINR